MISKKALVVAVCGAVAVPGVAQATHTTGKAGAPGQVCKMLKTTQKSELATFKATGAPTEAAVNAFRKLQHAAYKGCIKGAAKARSDHSTQQSQSNVNSTGAPGRVCKPMRTSRKADLEAFKSSTPTPTDDQVSAFKKTQRAAYKGCIQAAAKLRKQHNKPAQPNPNKPAKPNPNKPAQPGNPNSSS